MVRQKLSATEIIDLGKRLYNEKVRAKVEAQHPGRFVVVDVESGDFQVGDDDAAASQAMLARRPSAVLYGVRIGDEVAYHVGLGSTGKPA